MTLHFYQTVDLVRFVQCTKCTNSRHLTENEIEVSFFQRSEYDAFKSHPDVCAL